MIQVIYKAAEQAVTIRKANSVEDVSGDYNQYKEENRMAIEGRSVIAKGDNGFIQVATWKDGTYSYAITISGKGLSADELKILVRTVE